MENANEGHGKSWRTWWLLQSRDLASRSIVGRYYYGTSIIGKKSPYILSNMSLFIWSSYHITWRISIGDILLSSSDNLTPHICENSKKSPMITLVRIHQVLTPQEVEYLSSSSSDSALNKRNVNDRGRILGLTLGFHGRSISLYNSLIFSISMQVLLLWNSDRRGRKMTQVVAMDATKFRNADQFSNYHLERELNKVTPCIASLVQFGDYCVKYLAKL